MGKFKDFLKNEQWVKKPRTEAEQALWDAGFRCRKDSRYWERLICQPDSQDVLLVSCDMPDMRLRVIKGGPGGTQTLDCPIPEEALEDYNEYSRRDTSADFVGFTNWLDEILEDWL